MSVSSHGVKTNQGDPGTRNPSREIGHYCQPAGAFRGRTLTGFASSRTRAIPLEPRSFSSESPAVFLEVNKPQPVVLFEVIKGWVTGTAPDIGEMHHLQK